MSVSDPFLKRPLLTLVVSVLILLAGLLSLANLDVENLPPIAPSRSVCQLPRRQRRSGGARRHQLDGAAAQQPGAPGNHHLQQQCQRRRVQLSFRGNQGELDQINVQNEASLISRQLPQPVSRQGLRVRRSSSDLLMVLSFSDNTNTYSRAFISSWVDRQVREPLLRINGVGDVVLFGSSDLAYRLWLDATQLSRFELTIEDVKTALRRENVLAALGQVGDAPSPEGQQYTLPCGWKGGCAANRSWRT